MYRVFIKSVRFLNSNNFLLGGNMKIINISMERAQNGIFYAILTFVKFDHKFLRKIGENEIKKCAPKSAAFFTVWLKIPVVCPSRELSPCSAICNAVCTFKVSSS